MIDKAKEFNLEMITKAEDLLSKINKAENENPRFNEKLLNLFKECCDLFSKDSKPFRSSYYENEKKLNDLLIDDKQIENMKLLLNKTIHIYTELSGKNPALTTSHQTN